MPEICTLPLVRAALCGLSALTAAVPVAAQDSAQTNPLHEWIGAPEDFRISGSFRVRAEGIDGQFRPSPAPTSDGMLTLRSTLFVEYDAHPVRVVAELFDSRAYLQDDRSSAGTGEVNAFELAQAHLALDIGSVTGTGDKASVTAGRFTQDLGSRRLVARNQFRNTVNAFTGVRFEWQGADKDRLTLFWTMPHYRLPDTATEIGHNAVQWDRESSDLQFFGGHVTKADVNGGTLELYGYRLHEQDSPTLATRNRRLLTTGARISRPAKSGRFDYDFEAAYQSGKTRLSTSPADVADRDVSAYFFHAEIGRTFEAPWSPRVAIQYDLGSGDGRGANYTRFDTLFGSRRGEYGPTSLYGAVQRSNLSSPGVRFELTPNSLWDAAVSYRALWLDEATDSFATTAVRDASGGSGAFAGHQVEARVRHWIVPKLLRLDAGAAYLVKGEFLTHAPNAPDTGDSRYGYLDVTLTL